MSQHWSEDSKLASSALVSLSSAPISGQCSSHQRSKNRNVFLLLAQREISPRTKHQAKRIRGGSSNHEADLATGSSYETVDAKLALFSWVESQSLLHLSAQYCPLVPAPRSTIAAAFSSDGKTIASTHGDHTVKVIDCRSGKCLKILSGHRRTPWVVRFHPIHSDILVSGSLDHEVRLWDARTSDCIISRSFYRPIASLAFHAQGEFLAVATGHKLYIWNYNKRGEEATPVLVLKTRRSLRAVHFHPHGAPYLLTAEVNNIDSSESPLTEATSTGYLHYPPAVFIANSSSRPNNLGSGPSSSSSSIRQLVARLSSFPCVFWPVILRDDGQLRLFPGDWAPHNLSRSNNMLGQRGISFPSNYSNPDSENQMGPTPMDIVTEEITVPGPDIPMLLRNAEGANYPYHFSLAADLPSWELPPFCQGWLLGQTQNNESTSEPVFVGHARSRLVGSGEVGGSSNEQVEVAGTFEIPTHLLAVGSADLPCTVKLRIWQHDIKEPCAVLEQDKCRLTISHAVLCSEMGAHFSPCGRYLVACVACLMPQMEGDNCPQSQTQMDGSGSSSSPTRHPSSSNRIIYELRIYSLEEATFGVVLASRAIRAAHCLTSIQFSPTSEHVLLAYGRRHNSLLRSVVMDGETTIPIYTILEVYRVSDMELVKVLPSAEDEVNVACFHPSPGGGLAYGTKEGKLRILKYEGLGNVAYGNLEEGIMEIQEYAPEC
ncbi:Transducin family protein / WD-40 repeat family protein [Rhynchospora pubera]|uniref:Transducin family protein / WD-40 repeat family protein n=1 Tax=Rhynchospora pubera TaxID=906938 RepID=A0AAV8EZW8_9POAL|nr:Transducin family protein / WD-40 repeat family protein [Rhynchospora pubera]